MHESDELMDLFDVVELEQRFEMGWIRGGDVGVQYEPSNGDLELTAKVRF